MKKYILASIFLVLSAQSFSSDFESDYERLMEAYVRYEHFGEINQLKTIENLTHKYKENSDIQFLYAFFLDDVLNQKEKAYEIFKNINSADSSFMEAEYEFANNMPDRVHQNMKRAADGGSVISQFNLGANYYRQGEYLKAKEYFDKAANSGYPKAMYFLGLMYLNRNIEDSQSFELAYNYFLKSADEGVADAEYLLGRIYAGDYVQRYRDDELAKKYLLKASKKGHVDAAFRFSKFLPVDERVELLKNLKNFLNAEVLFEYAMALNSNPKTHEEAKVAMKDAADMGHVDAALIYAVMASMDGNQEHYLKYTKKAADLGDSYAKFNWGSNYYDRLGGVTLEEALPIVEQASSHGLKDAKKLYHKLKIVEKVKKEKAQNNSGN